MRVFPQLKQGHTFINNEIKVMEKLSHLSKPQSLSENHFVPFFFKTALKWCRHGHGIEAVDSCVDTALAKHHLE